MPRYRSGGVGRSFLVRTSKCRCGPVECRPVEPTLPIFSPAVTRSPFLTRIFALVGVQRLAATLGLDHDEVAVAVIRPGEHDLPLVAPIGVPVRADRSIPACSRPAWGPVELPKPELTVKSRIGNFLPAGSDTRLRRRGPWRRPWRPLDDWAMTAFEAVTDWLVQKRPGRPARRRRACDAHRQDTGGSRAGDRRGCLGHLA